MVDPLSLLRDFNINKKEIIERDNQIIFGEYSWPKNVMTNYLIKRGGKEGYIKEFYTLECLLYLLKNAQLIHPIYCQQAQADKIPAVRRPDRKQVLAYLNGEIGSCASIDKSVPSKKPQQVKRTHAHDFGESQAKKPCIEQTSQLKNRKQLAAAPNPPSQSSVPAYMNAETMADPLNLLRDYNVNKKEIIELDSQIIFGEFSWPKNVATNYRIKKSGKENSIEEFYTLECLLYLLKNMQLIHPVYCQQAQVDNIPAVRRPDRKQVLAYLNGEISTCASIDQSAHLKKP